jgi:hypothetical protein
LVFRWKRLALERTRQSAGRIAAGYLGLRAALLKSACCGPAWSLARLSGVMLFALAGVAKCAGLSNVTSWYSSSSSVGREVDRIQPRDQHQTHGDTYLGC